MAIRLSNYVYRYIVGNGNTHRFHYFMSSHQYILCLTLRRSHSVYTQREVDYYFLFSQMQPFKYGIAYPFRSACVDAESEGGNHFKAINVHADLIRQTDIPLRFIFFQYSAFINRFDCLGAITPNRLTSSASLIQMGSFGIVTVPCPVISMIFLFIFLPLIRCRMIG